MMSGERPPCTHSTPVGKDETKLIRQDFYTCAACAAVLCVLANMLVFVFAGMTQDTQGEMTMHATMDMTRRMTRDRM